MKKFTLDPLRRQTEMYLNHSQLFNFPYHVAPSSVAKSMPHTRAGCRNKILKCQQLNLGILIVNLILDEFILVGDTVSILVTALQPMPVLQ